MESKLGFVNLILCHPQLFALMATEQQPKLEEIKQLISDRFDKQDRKISDRFNKQDEKINDIRIELAGIKVDTTWIKWLFGGLLSFILILLSVIITVIFKLIG